MYFAAGPVGGSGSLKSDLWVVTEAPDKDEAKAGLPMVGAAGKVGMFALKAAGVDRKKVHVTNVVRCHPTGGRGIPRPPTGEEVAYCMERFLWPELEMYNPNAVVAMGELAMQALMGNNEDRKISEWRGAVREIEPPGKKK